MSEYELLRTEIRGDVDRISQYNSILYATTAVILTYAFDKDTYFLCLIPYIVILPLYLLTENTHKSVVRFAMYMYVFLEGKEYHWERRLYKLSRATESKYFRYLLLFKERIHYFFLSFICSFAATYKVIISDISNDKRWIPLLFVWTITLLAAMIMITNMTDYVKVKEEMLDKWQAVKAAEDAQKRKNARNPQ